MLMFYTYTSICGLCPPEVQETSTRLSHRPDSRALCRIKLLSVTHVLVDTWVLTVKPVYKLLNVSDDLKWTTNTHLLSRHN